jgi:Flp pilus assembly protein TadD
MRSPLPCLFLLATAVSISACSGGSGEMVGGHSVPMPPSTARAAVLSGEAAEGAGEFREAAGLYERAYLAWPSAELAARWGRAQRLAGDAKSATLQLQEASKKYPGDVGILTELGRSATAGGFLPEAGDALSRAVAAKGAGWAAFSAYGAYLSRLSSFDDAGMWFRRAEVAATDDRQRLAARANLAMLRAQRGDLAGAEAELREAASHPSAESRVHADLALVLGLRGDRAGAAAEMATAGASASEGQQMVDWLSPAQAEPAPAVSNATHVSKKHHARKSPPHGQ